MKKVILMAACLFMTIIIVKAQDAPATPSTTKSVSKKGGPKLTVEQRAQRSVDSLNAEVSLTDDQKAKVLVLATTRATNVEAIRTKYKGQPENKETAKTEIKAVKQEYHKSVKAILTPEQLQKLKAKHQEKKAAGKANALDTND